MTATTIADLEKAMGHAWTEPKAVLASEAPFPWPGTDVEEINPEWWEPRWDQPWRRQVARDRDAFGGEHVACAKAPIEGPNNPHRLRRELERAELDLAEAYRSEAEAREEGVEADRRVRMLKQRLKPLEENS